MAPAIVCYRYYRVLLISAVCYRARFFLWGALVALLPLATACYFFAASATACYFSLPLLASRLPRATACYRVRYRVLPRSLPRAIAFATACYRVLSRATTANATAGQSAAQNGKAAGARVPPAECARIANSESEKKNSKKTSGSLEFVLRHQKVAASGERASVCSTILGVIGNVECIRVGLKSLFKTNKWLLLLQLQQAASSYKTRAPSSPRWIFGCRRG